MSAICNAVKALPWLSGNGNCLHCCEGVRTRHIFGFLGSYWERETLLFFIGENFQHLHRAAMGPLLPEMMQ